MAGTGHEVAKREDHSPVAVDPQDEPSAEWGWHGTFPKGSVIMGWVSAVIILLMLIGNHEGRVEDLWLVGTGVVMVLLLIRHTVRAKRSWRR